VPMIGPGELDPEPDRVKLPNIIEIRACRA
jgi:hypothetical protein